MSEDVKSSVVSEYPDIPLAMPTLLSDVAKDRLHYLSDMSNTDLLIACKFPEGAFFSYHDEEGEHDPVYTVLPSGEMLSLNHYNDGESNVPTDCARAVFITRACNTALSTLRMSNVEFAKRVKSYPTFERAFHVTREVRDSDNYVLRISDRASSFSFEVEKDHLRAHVLASSLNNIITQYIDRAAELALSQNYKKKKKEEVEQPDIVDINEEDEYEDEREELLDRLVHISENLMTFQTNSLSKVIDRSFWFMLGMAVMLALYSTGLIFN